MRSNSGRRTWISRPVVIVASVVILAAVGAVVAWWVTQPDTLPQASCGTADTNRLSGDTQILSAAPGALTCFSTAARGCRSASIEVVEIGNDTGTDDVFTIGPSGTPCQVRRLSQDYSGNFGGWTGPITTTSCQRSAVNRRGVVLRCGELDVLIPATVTVPGG